MDGFQGPFPTVASPEHMEDVTLSHAVPHPFGCLALSGAVGRGEREVCLPARSEAGRCRLPCSVQVGPATSSIRGAGVGRASPDLLLCEVLRTP